jgi:hypothetical protein
MNYLIKIKDIAENFCIDHPLLVAFTAGFILGGLIFA